MHCCQAPHLSGGPVASGPEISLAPYTSMSLQLILTLLITYNYSLHLLVFVIYVCVCLLFVFNTSIDEFFPLLEMF